MKALIVDDERLARAELRRLLKAFPEIAIVGEAVNGDDAVEKIGELDPDLIFLDIQMPGRSGFDVLEALDRVPAVIFTTAFDEYALKAFEVSAIDYLLKPVDPQRLAGALSKAMRGYRPQEGEEGGGAETISEEEQIFVKDGERCWFVKLGDIVLLESEGNYTRLYFNGNKPCILRSLNYLESRLDPRRFFRASRKHIINLKWVESIDVGLGGGLLVKLAGGFIVEMSRRQTQKFKEMMRL